MNTSVSQQLLEVRDLYVQFATEGGTVEAVNGVSFGLDRGETLAVLGESGSGKSVSAAAIMDIIDSPPGKITGGKIFYDGTDLLGLPRRQRRRINGPDIAMVFQDALIALNPVYSVGWQIAEMLITHSGLTRKAARAEAVQLLGRVGIAGADLRFDDYPHQFSGGQRQRVMIAMAIALKPAVLIADEPTTALDVTVQAEIMDLLGDLKNDFGMGLLLITHDLGVVAQAADRVVVMYAGRIVESAPVKEIFARPRHPYTMGLLRSLPRNDQTANELDPIPGSPPDLLHMPAGCAFHPRCEFAQDLCHEQVPALKDRAGSQRRVACHRSEELLDD